MSAVESLPVEIWSDILALLVRSPLLPYHDTTFAQSLALFSTGCDPDRLDRELAQITSHLRQVCRSWDTMVQRLQPVVVHCNFEADSAEDVPSHVVPYPIERNQTSTEATRQELLKARRLAVWTPFFCDCGYGCRSSPPAEAVERLQKKDLEYYLSGSVEPRRFAIPTQDLVRLEVFVAGAHRDATCPIPLFDRMPNLKALYWSFKWSNRIFHTAIQHRIHKTLTHLKITILWNSLYDVKYPVNFDRLSFLGLTVSHLPGDSMTKIGQFDLASWATFPALRNLRLSIRPHKSKWGEVTSFFGRVGPSLSGLVLKNLGGWFPVETWGSFPLLREFGIEENLLTTDNLPPPTSFQPLDILYGFTDYMDEFLLPPRGHTLLDDFILMCQKWRVRRITMLQTWHEAAGILRVDPPKNFSDSQLPRRVDFYKRLGGLGVEICDRDGVHVTDPWATGFRVALQEYADAKEPKVEQEYEEYEAWSEDGIASDADF